MLERMIDINAKKRLETISQCHRLSSEGRGHFNRSSEETLTVLEIVLSESDVYISIELEVAELQATELELSSAVLSLLPLT